MSSFAFPNSKRSQSLLLGIEHLRVPVRDIHHRIDSVEICKTRPLRQQTVFHLSVAPSTPSIHRETETPQASADMAQRGERKKKLTNRTLRPEIRAGHDPHAQVILHFADDFHRVVELEVSVLFNKFSQSEGFKIEKTLVLRKVERAQGKHKRCE